MAEDLDLLEMEWVLKMDGVQVAALMSLLHFAVQELENDPEAQNTIAVVKQLQPIRTK